MGKKNTEPKSEKDITHDNNIMNFFRIIEFCVQKGSKYNPPDDDLSIVKLRARHAEVEEMQKKYVDAVVDKKIAINTKQNKIALVKSLSRRAYNSLAITKENKKDIEDAKRIMKEITGDNVRRKKDTDGNVIEHTVSNSHLGATDVLGNFYSLIILLENCSYYNAQEDALKVANLHLFCEEANDAWKDVMLKSTVANERMRERDVGLYGRDTGLVDISLRCKMYMRSLFGARSEEAKTVSAIKVKRLKRLKQLP